jgi:lipoate-protein ligase A
MAHKSGLKVRLLDSGAVSYLRSQTIYHGLAHAMDEKSPDTVVLLNPAEPYVCVGYHQEVEKEVDVEYCRAHHLPILRREVGGGAVYLDSDQLFWQIVFHQRRAPRQVEEIYRLFLRGPVEVYREMGIPAEYRPVNDIQVEGRKICGTGAATIGAAVVVVGNLMFDFNYEQMVRVLKVPSEKFRDKVYHSLQEYLTTIKRELGDKAPAKASFMEEARHLLAEKFAETLGVEIERGELTEEEEEAIARLDERFTSAEWLYQKGGRPKEGIKIATDVRVLEGIHKAPGGLIRATVLLRQGRIEDLTISGDFFFYPAEQLAGLEQALKGAADDEQTLTARIGDFYQAHAIQSPGVTAQDMAQAIVEAWTRKKS